MTENESIVNSLEANVKKLILLHEQLKEEKQALMSENGNLKATIQIKETEYKDLHSRYENLKLAKLLITGSDDPHEAKLKVNRIVREIDKCIALLNK
jgi:hypothetical protein